MNNENLPRRGFLIAVGAGLTALVPDLANAAPQDQSVRVTISGSGDAFWGVVAHFRLPGGESVPFYAWSAGPMTSSFTMPASAEGLRLTAEGEYPRTLKLNPRAGTRTLRGVDGSRLRITVAAV